VLFGVAVTDQNLGDVAWRSQFPYLLT